MSTTLSRDGIEAVLASLGVESPIPQFPSADIQNSPMSIFVSHLAGILTQLTKCEPLVAYEAIQWPNDEGDLVMILPRLRMKDINVKVLASELMHQVSEAEVEAP
jgi:arginyl-tRNA synthetase